MAKKKFYAVKKGNVPGIYENWPAAEAQVKGYPGAQFKGFPTKDEARAWLNDDSPAKKQIKGKVKKPAVVAELIPSGTEIIIHTDGGAINNPGPGGYGVVISHQAEQIELSGGFRLTTNNRMELMACIMALRQVKGSKKKMVLFSDSSYVVNGIAKGWVKKWQRNGWLKSDKMPVLNKDLWEELIALSTVLDIQFRWVKGHAGNALNERCDTLAVASARGNDLPVDVEYESTMKK